jgi:hypothetical protein
MRCWKSTELVALRVVRWRTEECCDFKPIPEAASMVEATLKEQKVEL